MKSQRMVIWPVLALILIGAMLRVWRHFGLLPLPPNVAPVSAIAFLAAAYLPRRWGWLVPLGLMAVSDVAIGGYDIRIMGAVYASFGTSYGIGIWLRQGRPWHKLVTTSLLGSVLFFLISNAAVWLWSGMYLPTVAGLGQSYLAGLPFFRNTILGDLGYTALGFGLVEGFVLYWRRYIYRQRVGNHG